MKLSHAIYCFRGILIRESLRFLKQRSRFFAALVRPLVWLFIFAAGFRSVLGVSIIEPYQTYVLYEEYIAPGLLGMILLFSGMQSSLSMFFASSALYPLWRLRESSELLYWIANLNPFTHAVEFVRFALYSQFNWQAGLITLLCTIVFLAVAIRGYDPRRGALPRKGGAPV